MNAIQQSADAKRGLATGAPSAENRFAKRIPCSTPASLWVEGLPGAIKCYVRDQSSTGALLETSVGDVNLLDLLGSIGKPFTMTIQTVKERTDVTCELAWRAGRRLGARYVGPFRTVAQANRPVVRKISVKR